MGVRSDFFEYLNSDHRQSWQHELACVLAEAEILLLHKTWEKALKPAL